MKAVGRRTLPLYLAAALSSQTWSAVATPRQPFLGDPAPCSHLRAAARVMSCSIGRPFRRSVCLDTMTRTRRRRAVLIYNLVPITRTASRCRAGTGIRRCDSSGPRCIKENPRAVRPIGDGRHVLDPISRHLRCAAHRLQAEIAGGRRGSRRGRRALRTSGHNSRTAALAQGAAQPELNPRTTSRPAVPPRA